VHRSILIFSTALTFLCLSPPPAGATGNDAAPSGAPAANPGDYVHEAIINGPTDLVWRLLTTKQGMESWLAPQADVDLRVGGLVRTHQDPKGKIGDPQTLVNRVLAIEPGKKFAFRVDKSPDGFLLGQFLVGTWYDVVLDPLSHDRTRVRCVGHGFPPGPAAFAVRPAFDKGTEMALAELEKAVERLKPKGGSAK
jgi:uncharacterized protein YndB with AHSA1/START domain